MTLIYEEEYYLSAGETNAEQELSLPVLVTKLIDIATAHANHLGIGNPSMTGINGGWVLSRLTVEMHRYPKANDNFRIATWIESSNRHYSERAFKIFSSDGSVFGYARSIWMVIDTNNHLNLGLSQIGITEKMIVGQRPPIDNQARHVVIVEPDSEVEMPKGAIPASHPPFDYCFKYCDLDFYRHVNTVRYVTLLLNRFSLEDHDSSFISRLELSFMHEAKYGMETVLLRHDSNNMSSSFLLRKKDDSSPLFFARVFRKSR